MKNLNLEEINLILSDTLQKVASKEIPLRQAVTISRIASTLSKNIANVELKNRVELLEQMLKNRR